MRRVFMAEILPGSVRQGGVDEDCSQQSARARPLLKSTMGGTRPRPRLHSLTHSADSDAEVSIEERQCAQVLDLADGAVDHGYEHVVAAVGLCDEDRSAERHEDLLGNLLLTPRRFNQDRSPPNKQEK